MTRTPRVRAARLALLAALAVVVGAVAPAVGMPEPASAASDGQMIYPASGNIQSKVGDGCRNNSRAHDGIDISGQGGTPILAAYDGVVKVRTSSSGYGNYVDIEHAAGYVTRYAHMANPGDVAPGTRVSRGQQIGVVGKTGATTAYHLHFEVWRNGSVYAAINNGFTCLANVTRGASIPMTFPGLAVPVNSAVASADYDRDGKADLVGVAGDSDLLIFSGSGTGAIGAGSIVTSGWGTRRHLTHADFDGDGRADLLAARPDGALEFYSGSDDGGFDGFSLVGSGWYGLLHVTSCADFTGDGRQDVVVVTPGGDLLVHVGNGSGGFTGAARAVDTGWQAMRHVVGGDFDGDGRGDLMSVDAAGILAFHRGTGAGFAPRQAVGTGWAPFTALTGGLDYDGDGRADLIARSPEGDLFLYPGTGVGAFGSRTLLGSGFGGYLQLE
ncbi:peptidoglycan DD-metalloendopeptidase family protein [Microbacterium sp. 179-I 3D4 NHS]|uniref:peptidoglycan DD-metalloendopeptidase family protein n=1 Tax=Microbacterium sp. 179-I 3D4 NHS TaxID=3142381 RepID=UPI0039A3005D